MSSAFAFSRFDAPLFIAWASVLLIIAHFQRAVFDNALMIVIVSA